jgi:alkylation response protein AidB-like acyl-CoA dehydrogenase
LLTSRLGELESADDESAWPVKSLALLGEAGCWGNPIARAHGGRQTAPLRQLQTYEAIAAGSVACALILTQHDAACELLGAGDNAALADRWLPRCATAEALLTVGISQLTTSRRHGRAPAMRATADDKGFLFDGIMPWVTSAPKADAIVVGAVLDDDRKILACIPTDAPGLRIDEPMRLMALRSSLTTQATCERVRVPAEWVVRGPAEQVLDRRAPVKSLTVSAVGIGVARALVEGVRARASRLDGASDLIDGPIGESYERIRRSIFEAAGTLHDPEADIPGMEIRAAVNALIVRLAATLMTLAKGSGYLSSDPTQRRVREAMFFLVWSAPPSVQLGTIRNLW